jgi:type I restriction enzyme S subunit
MGHIKRRDLNEAMVSVPSLVEMSEMTLIIEPLIDKLIVNNKQINLLVSYRDNLLKKLMSGDVKVAI